MSELPTKSDLVRRLSAFSLAMESLRGELLFVQGAAEEVAKGRALSRDDMTRLHIAALRLFDAGEVLNG